MELNILSLRQQALLTAYQKGYRVINGEVVYRNIKVKGYNRIHNGTYHTFSVQISPNKRSEVPTHRLVAYQKFGNNIFKKGIVVRHLDSNSLNNKEENINIGTQSDNVMDRSEEARRISAIRATSFIKKHNHEAIVKMKNEGMTYGQIMHITGIRNPGSLFFILNKSIGAKNQKKVELVS